MDNGFLEAEKQLIGDLATSREAWNNLVVLCDRFGSRFGGTEGEKGARDYILGKMREYGLDDPHTEEFSYTGWVRGVTTLESTAPQAQEFPVIALPYTGTHDIEGELLHVGYGTPTDFGAYADHIPGKIVMAAARSPSYYRRGIHRCEKIGRAIALGARGFIWMRWDAGFLPETGAARWNREVEVPCVGVAREYGEEMLRMAKAGPVRVRIRTENEVRPMPSWNIVGDLRGATKPDEVIVIGAHFDGHDIAPGAMDDGSGAVVVLEIARALAAHRHLLGRTLRFITFPLEEIGLIGAYAYVDAHRHEVEKFKFMLNLDGAGRGAEFGGVQLQGDRTELALPLRNVGRAAGGNMVVDNGLSLYSDHFPFVLAGVPAGSYARMDAPATGVRGWGHTAADTLDKVSPANLQSSAQHIARLMLHLSNAEDWPARLQTQAEIEAILKRYELDEVLRLELRYPF
ncbi:MAG: M28 family peptidase [Bacillota bacterium]|nr:M28 family peptidase [Bacillota bacterium]